LELRKLLALGASRALPPVLIFTLALTVTLDIYLAKPLAYGIDGPYYIVQYYSIRDSGLIKYPDPPLAFYALFPFQHLSYVLSGDPALGLKVGVSLFTSLTAALMYVALRRIYPKDYVAPVAIPLIYALSPFTLRLETDFIKNSLAMVFIPLLLTALTVRSARLRALLIVTSVAGAALTHVLTYGVLVLLIAGILLHNVVTSSVLSRLDATLLALTPVAVTATIFAAPSIVGYDTCKLASLIKALTPSGATPPRPPHAPPPTHPGAVVASLPGSTYLALTYTLSVIGLVASTVLRRGLVPALSATSSVLNAVLNTPITPWQWLMRFSLMSSILLPLSLTWVLKVRRPYVKLLVLAVVAVVAIHGLIHTAPRLGPSIGVGEYLEVKGLRSIIPEGSRVAVPNAKLRYWVEALNYGVYELLAEPPGPGGPTYVIVEAFRHPHPAPPHSMLVHRGRYLEVFLVGWLRGTAYP